MDYDLPEPVDYEKRITIIIVAVIISAAIGYMGYRQFIKWHVNAVQSAVLEEKMKMAEKSADLEYQILQLQNQLAMRQPAPVPEDRLTEVFGNTVAGTPAEPERSCDALKNKITAFFSYLQKNSYAGTSQTGKNLDDVFGEMTLALAANPPMIVDETRDIVSLKHNLAHFYRILSKDRFEMVKTILTAESDVIEHAMADFYGYYAAGDCCKNDDETCISINTLYEYAGFFLNTFAGKSYLFRRNSTVRCLTDYYAVLILDSANDAEVNRYGIDIRPHIDLALDNISSQNHLIFQDQYLAALNKLKEKYRS